MRPKCLSHANQGCSDGGLVFKYRRIFYIAQSLIYAYKLFLKFNLTVLCCVV